MKTLSRNLFAILFAVTVLFGSSAFANTTTDDKDGITTVVTASDKFAYSIYAVKETLKFRLNFENEDATPITVKIYDSQGQLVFTDLIKKQVSAHRNYDLSEKGKGVYKVEIIDGDFRAVQEIGVGMRTPQGEFNAYISKTLSEGSLKIAYQNGNPDGVNIVLRDEKGNIMYEELSANEQYSRKFNLSKLNRGTYTMSITSGKKTVEQVYNVL
jgi:hypothetical protein